MSVWVCICVGCKCALSIFDTTAIQQLKQKEKATKKFYGKVFSIISCACWVIVSSFIYVMF